MATPSEAVREGDPVAALLLKLRRRDIVTDHEEEVLRDAISETEEIRGRRSIVRAGASLSRSTLVYEGLVARYKDLADGQRQILEIHVAGDFVDLHGFLLKRLEHHVGTLSPVRVAYVSHDRLRRITEEEPHLARMLWFSTLIDAAIQREKILTVGRRVAIARVAHLVCELALRFETVGLADGGRFALPLTQLDLADATGLTPVHVNRMLRRLRDDGIVTFRGGEVNIHDRDRLEQVAGFDPAYLYLERRPR